MDADTAMGFRGDPDLFRSLGPCSPGSVIDALGAEVERLRALCRDVAAARVSCAGFEDGDVIVFISRATLEAVKKEAGRG